MAIGGWKFCTSTYGPAARRNTFVTIKVFENAILLFI